MKPEPTPQAVARDRDDDNARSLPDAEAPGAPRDGSGLSRRSLLALAALTLLSRGALARGGGRRASTPRSTALVIPEQRESIRAALRWLADAQQPGGMWGTKAGTRVADTALAILALMAGGNTVSSGKPLEFGSEQGREFGPERTRGPYGAHVKRGIEYLARLAWGDGQKVRGYIHDDEQSKMHGHGFATLALAEASGNLGGTNLRNIKERVAKGQSPARMTLGEQVRLGLFYAVRCTQMAQDRDTGGWLYDPVESGHEGSMTVTQIAALRAAGDCGIRVSGAVMKKAYQYVRESQNLAHPDFYGGFAYQKTDPKRVSYQLTAAALTTLFGLGRYGTDSKDAEIIQNGMQYLDRHLDSDGLHARQWFYYGMFYGAQAVYLAADERRLRTHWPRIRHAVMDKQRGDGSFARVESARSLEYCTAIACLTLQVPLESLPIFQRK